MEDIIKFRFAIKDYKRRLFILLVIILNYKEKEKKVINY